MAGALIVTAMLGPADLAVLDAERRAHFPPERNFLAAHLTMFHALAPSLEGEVTAMLARLAGDYCPPKARLASVMSLGRGVAYRVESDELDAIRAILADHFHGALGAQDAHGWRAHVTIQNKVEPRTAKALYEAMRAEFVPRPLEIAGLALHRYMDGPWEPIARYRFRGRASPLR